MDEEMEDFIGEEDFVHSEIDIDYEFDAARFFDFTRPESISETDEAERWFQSAGSYPPSPFIVKLNWIKDIPVLEAVVCPNLEAGESMDFISNNSEVDNEPEVPSSRETENGGKNYHTDIAQDIMKAKTKSLAKSSKPKSSTLMKPTTSYLAKQNKARNVYSNQFCRSQKPLTKVDQRSLQIPPGFEIEATKRQKLESGYLSKVAHLKHQTLLLHKLSKKRGPVETNSLHSRSKVTIPREPDLETAQRASRRSRKASECGQQATLNSHTFKARPLNRKILEAPSLPLPKKSKPQLPGFQIFHLKTMERARQHSSASVLNAQDRDSVISSEDTDFKGPNSEDALKQENYETLHKLKAHSSNKKLILSKGDTGAVRNIKRESTVPTELKGPTDKNFSENPPIELFNKLSLKSGFETNTISQSKPHLSMKGSKENAPSSFQLEFRRCVRKPNQCGRIRRIPEVACQACQPNMNRSLDIR